VGLRPSPVGFSSLRHSHKLSRSWLLGAHSLLPPSPARLVYLQFWEGILSPLFGAQCAPPSLLCVFIVLIAYYSVSLFTPGGGSVCPGVYADLAQGCLWKYRVPLRSPCPRLPKPSGHGRLAAAQGSSWFLHLMWSRDSLHRLEVWRGQSFASSWWPCLQGVSSVSPRFHFRRHTFCFSL
jgi:hypothetical protein